MHRRLAGGEFGSYRSKTMSRVVVLVLAALSLTGCFEAELGVEALHPVADAGFDQRRHLGVSSSLTVEVDGRASCDPQGAPLSAGTFSIVEGPTRPPLSALGRLRAVFEVQEPGEYLIALRVTAEDAPTELRKSAPDYVVITIVEGEGEDMVLPPPSTNACGQQIELDP
jgi:hypothetical protein